MPKDVAPKYRQMPRYRHQDWREIPSSLILDCKVIAQDLVTRELTLICSRQVGQRQSRKAEPITVNCDSFNRT